MNRTLIFQVIVARDDTLMLHHYTPIRLSFSISILLELLIHICHYGDIQELLERFIFKRSFS